jgi:hypothetical protein
MFEASDVGLSGWPVISLDAPQSPRRITKSGCHVGRGPSGDRNEFLISGASQRLPRIQREAPAPGRLFTPVSARRSAPASLPRLSDAWGPHAALLVGRLARSRNRESSGTAPSTGHRPANRPISRPHACAFFAPGNSRGAQVTRTRQRIDLVVRRFSFQLMGEVVPPTSRRNVDARCSAQATIYIPVITSRQCPAWIWPDGRVLTPVHRATLLVTR